MKNRHLITSGLLLPALLFSLSGCGNDSKPDVQPVVISTQDVIYQLGMKGYASEPAVIGRFGVANSQSEAQAGRGTLLQGTITWNETKGGKETKPFLTPTQVIGEKKWVFLSTHTKPMGAQLITLNWLINNSLTLSATSTDTIVVQEFVVK